MYAMSNTIKKIWYTLATFRFSNTLINKMTLLFKHFSYKIALTCLGAMPKSNLAVVISCYPAVGVADVQHVKSSNYFITSLSYI